MNKAKLLLCLLAATTLTPALADENLWLYTRGVETRPEGSTEVKLQSIWRLGKNSGNYYFQDLRPEIEYGITDRFTLGAQVMLFHHVYDNVEWAPYVDTQGGPGGSFNKAQVGGFQITGKYNVLNPFTNPIGMALGFSYDRRSAYRLDGAAIEQDSFIPRLFLQKNFLDDTLIWSMSGAWEFERRTSPGVLEEEMAPDVAMGISYRIRPNLYIGLETRFQSDFLTPKEEGVPVEGRISNWDLGDFRLGDQFQWGLYVGPSVHYSQKNWWLTVGALMQVKGWSRDGPAASNQGKNWDEHERLHIGFILGYEFTKPSVVDHAISSAGKNPVLTSTK
jgi:hypothetical protein